MNLKEEIINLRMQGYSYNYIVDKLKCAKSTVSYHCKNINDDEIKRKNIEIKNKKQIKEKCFILENIDVDNIIELRKNKVNYIDIKNKTGHSINVIKKVCRKFNMINDRLYSMIDDFTIEKINYLYSEYKSLKLVSLELNISRNTVKNKLNDENKKILNSKKKCKCI